MKRAQTAIDRARASIKVLLVCVALAIAGSAFSQDWATLQGSDSRTGVNSVSSTSPGLALLSWFLPSSFASTFFRQVMSPEVTITNGTMPEVWSSYGMANPSAEAQNVFDPVPTGDATEDTFSGSTAFQAAIASSTAIDYYAVPSTPSTANPNTPTIPDTLTNLAVVSFKIEPANTTNRVAASYSLSTWIPVGPSTVSGSAVYQARFEVYTIQDSSGSVFTDVVDTFLSGTGWVRLGGGGGTTNKTFQYDGVNPIVVTLYNTVPRNAMGILEDTPGNLVYADAIKAAPMTGGIVSSPIISSFDPSTHTGTVHAVAVVNQALTSNQSQVTPSAFFQLGSGDTGNGTSSTVTASSAAVLGVYKFTFSTATTASGLDPNGSAIAPMTVGTAYSSSGLAFTVTAGSTAFVSGDTFTITVQGQSQTVTQGVVESVDTTGNLRWHWSPTEVSSSTTTMNTTMTSSVTSTSPWTVTSTSIGAKGATYLTTPSMVTSFGSASPVTFKPGTNLQDGSYQVQMWVPGSGGGFSFAQAETVQITEGAATTTVTVNCDAAGGWVTLGSRMFVHSNATGNPLQVIVYNYSALSGDATRSGFADAIQFVGASNLAINSTPVQTTALVTPSGGGAAVSTAVTLVAAEDGRIYCLDSTGNGHGDTFLYWAYPSLPTVSPDPNQATGIDGPGPTAQMPTTFNLSSAVVENISGHPYLYIGSSNGRIYAIDVEGRGDTTTSRLWSYPDDYPAAPESSALGPISGSLAFLNDGTLPPTIIVPTSQGRIYALDAAGEPTTRTTFTHWTFPSNDLSVSGFGTWNSVNVLPLDSAWSSPTNAQVADNAYAQTAPDNASSGSGQSAELQGTAATSVGGIPSTATITGIQVQVYRFATAGATTGSTPLFIKDSELDLMKAGAVLTSSNHADTADNWPTSPASPAVQSYGGQTDLWNQTWSPSDFNSGFGVSLRVSGNGNTTSGDTLPIANVDFIQVRVYYTAQAAIGPVVSTPNVAFGDIYFGTAVKPGDSTMQSSGFFAINADTGVPDSHWVTNNPGNQYGQFNGTSFWNLFALAATDTGNGTCSSITSSSTTPPGTYTFTFTTSTSASGTDPFGAALSGAVTVGSAFTADGITFTIFAGSTPFVPGDIFTITVGTTLGDFTSGAVAIPASELNVYGSSQSDSIVAMNNNEFLTSLYADGSNAGKVQWTTNSLNTTVVGNLSYAPVTVADNSGTGSTQTAPLVMVPTADGRFDGMFALNDGVVNDGAQSGSPLFGARNVEWTRLAWEYNATAPITASMAVGQNLMLGADGNGILYAFGNSAFGGSGAAPGSPSQTPNAPGSSPYASDFLDTKVGFVTQALYQQAQAGTITAYSQISSVATPTARYYDWGETVYIAVYDFPYSSVTNLASRIQPPQVYLQMSGTYSRTSTSSKLIDYPTGGAGSGAPPSRSFATTGAYNDGYAIYAYPIGSGGLSSLLPGPISVTTSIQCYGLTPNLRIPVGVAMPTGLGANTVEFGVANPLALRMVPTDTATTYTHQIAYFPIPGDTSDTGNQVVQNGNPQSANMTGDIVANLMAPESLLAENSTGSYTIQLVDRSALPLLRGPGVGIQNARILRAPLAWSYMSNPMDPIPVGNRIPSFFAGFEDYPINFPNDSLDYPDIAEDAVAVVSNPNTTPQDPVVTDVPLIAPTITGTGSPTTPPARTLNPTPVQITVNTPQFQPQNDSTTAPDSAGTSQYAGYKGTFMAYVDATGIVPTQSIAQSMSVPYRYFNVALGIQPDFHFYSNTPTVDLGSLPAGAGLPLNSSSFVPDSNSYSGMFKQFNVSNDGNENLLTLQVARQNGPTSSPTAIGIFPTDQNQFGWIQDLGHIVTDIDYAQGFSPLYPFLGTELGGVPYAILQKPRVGDKVPTTMSRNPVRRANGNLGVTAGPLLSGVNEPSPAPPRVSITIPFGMPVGTYSNLMEVIDSTNGILDPALPTLVSEPGFNLTFKVAETGLTSKLNTYGDVLLDNYVTSHDTFLFTNGEPAAFRDLNGNLHIAFSSTRPSFTPASSPTAGATTRNDQIFAASLAAQSPITWSNSYWLSDLDQFQGPSPSTGTYFSKDAGPYPSTPVASLFDVPSTTGYSVNSSVPARFNSPAFPAVNKNPFTGHLNTSGPYYMAFLGHIQVQTSNALVDDNKVFITQATVSNGALQFTPSPYPVMMPEQLTVPTGGGSPTANNTLITTTAKERPSIVQFDTNATVFYGESGAGHGQIKVATFAGSSPPPGQTPTSWTSNTDLPLPNAFTQVGAPSVSARPYNVNAAPLNDANGNPVQYLFELAFPAKLAGASHSDVFYGRLASDVYGQPVKLNNTTTPAGFLDLDAVTSESLANEGRGVYQAAGVDWDISQRIALTIDGIYRPASTNTGNGVCSVITYSSAAKPGIYTFTLSSPTAASGIDPQGHAMPGLTVGTPYLGDGLNFTVNAGSVPFVSGDTFTVTILPEIVDTGANPPTPYQVDQTTGILSADNTALGGRVYLNPATGTVQLSGNAAASNLSLALSYTPRVLRVSSGNVTGQEPNVLYDNRIDSDVSYWTDFATHGVPSTDQPDDRFDFIYTAPSAGAGQSARIYMSTYRFAVVLPESMATGTNGVFAVIPTVTGAKGDYQFDPAKGRIYFTDADEGNDAIQVTYQGVSSTGVVSIVPNSTYSVEWLNETPETAVQIDKPANESQVSAFLDPFDETYPASPTVKRPGMIWLVWTSTRNGGPDVFFQTIAPNFTPTVVTK